MILIRKSVVDMSSRRSCFGNKIVIPAWIAGIKKPRMASFDHIHVTWIPAVHAGMTSYFYKYE